MEKLMLKRPTAGPRLLAASIVLACVMLACGINLPDTISPGQNPEPVVVIPSSDPTPGPDGPDSEEERNDSIPAAADAALVLANHSSEPICQVFISPTTDDSWNDDWLGGQVIEPGGTYTFSVASGRYDLQASDCSGGELDVVWDTLISGSRDWWITDGDAADDGTGGGGAVAGDATLTLVNNSGRTLCYVYISPTTDDYWNDNWLGPGEIVAPGESHAFSVLSGDYDLRADDCDHNQVDVVWAMPVTGSQTWQVP